MLRFVVLAASALASAADWDAGTNATCPRLWSACGGDATAWTGRLDASELLVMVVTGQATWKKRVGSMILPTWGRHVSASLVLLSDACGSDGTVPTVTLKLEGLPPGAWGVFPKQDRYAASKATGYELAQLRWPVGLQFAAWLAAKRPFRWALVGAGTGRDVPDFKGSSLGRVPLVSAHFWTSDHPSERSRSVDAFCSERARTEHSC
jgi:hypothetical protein